MTRPSRVASASFAGAFSLIASAEVYLRFPESSVAKVAALAVALASLVAVGIVHRTLVLSLSSLGAALFVVFPYFYWVSVRIPGLLKEGYGDPWAGLAYAARFPILFLLAAALLGLGSRLLLKKAER